MALKLCTLVPNLQTGGGNFIKHYDRIMPLFIYWAYYVIPSGVRMSVRTNPEVLVWLGDQRVEDPFWFWGHKVKRQGHLLHVHSFWSITLVPFGPQCSNFIGWLSILGRRPVLILGSQGQRSWSLLL
jgi:hypothetical protein